jgi:death-on-curing protein
MTDVRQPWLQWISDATIADLYAEGIKRWHGLGSPPKPGCLEAALGAAYSAEQYQQDATDEGTETLQGLIFCGYLLFYLATKHCYVDGNKRIAWACATFVLLSFGLTIQATQQEVVEFCLSISRGEIRHGSEVTVWLSERLIAIN